MGAILAALVGKLTLDQWVTIAGILAQVGQPVAEQLIKAHPAFGVLHREMKAHGDAGRAALTVKSWVEANSDLAIQRQPGASSES